MAVRNIRVIGDRMEPRRIYAGTRGSYITEVAFTFSGEWDGLTKKLIFYPVRGKPVYINYTYGSEKIPYEVMQYSGDAIMLMSGYSVETDGSLGVKIVTASAYVTVDPAESDTQNEPDIPEATEFEKIVAKLGAPYIGENGNWFVWDVYTHEFADTGLPARGEKGETGRGLTILGKYGSLDELRAAVKDAQPGDAYAVGEKAPYTIYIWDDVTGDFTNHGDLRGVGITKIEQITDNTGSGEPNTIRIVTDDGEEYDYTVYNGERGHPGNIWIGETEPPDDSYTIWLNPGGAVSGFLESHQGTENAGRVLAVGEDGVVAPTDWLQADWDQNDSAEKDYVKNRTHWADLQLSGSWLNHYEVNPLTAGIGVHPLVIAMEGKEDFSFDRFLEPEYLRTILSLKITFTSGGYGDMDFTKGFFNTIKYIDDYNYKSLTNSVQGYEFYCIRDVTALSEQYREMFTANGAYLRVFEGTGELKASRVAFRCLKFNQLDERYIPDTIARTDYVDKKTLTDTTLTQEGKAADAKAVGDALADARTAADNAQTAADNAQDTADNAVSLANNAQATADNAIPAPATASVGQTIKVSAVDENGKPTAWEAADPEEVWELLADVTIEEEIKTVKQLWEPMKKVRIEVYTPAAAADTNYMPVTIYTTDDQLPNFVTGRFYPTALPRKSEYYSEYRVAMEEYDGMIIMRFTESNDLARNSSGVVGSGTLKEVTSDGNSLYADKFENVYTTGMHLQSYSLFPVGSTFKFWGVRA